jgi:ATP-dependent DNA helicase RecG
VTSPGGFVAGVSASNVLTCEPKARNPALAWAAREIRLGERLGVGVDRMYRSMIEAGGDPPTFVEIEGETAVRVRLNAAGNTEIARFVAQLPTDGDGEHEIDVLMVLHSICRKRTLDANDLAPLTQRTTTEAQTLLERMTRAPWLLIEPTRQTVNNRLPKYRLTNESLQQLGNAVHYHRRSADDIDRKVLAHVEEYGRVTNQTVRNLLDVSVTRASSILRDLCDRGLLIKTSEQQRGPNVEYAQGENFDNTRPTRARKPPRMVQPRRRPAIPPNAATLFDP